MCQGGSRFSISNFTTSLEIRLSFNLYFYRNKGFEKLINNYNNTLLNKKL